MTAKFDLVSTASERATSEIDRRIGPQAQALALRLDRLANVIGERTRGLDGTLGDRADALARTTRGTAAYVRAADTRRLIADGETLVRRYPRASAIVLAVAGFAAARYLKASPRS